MSNFTEDDLRRLGYSIEGHRAVRLKGVMPSESELSQPTHLAEPERRINPATGGVTHPPKSTSKYKNKPCYVGDLRFDSQHEAEVWIALTLQERAHQISDLQRQVPFDLHCGTPMGLRIVVAQYVADFVWKDHDGAMHIGDAKSVATKKNQVYQLKRRWLNLEYGFVVQEL